MGINAHSVSMILFEEMKARSVSRFLESLTLCTQIGVVAQENVQNWKPNMKPQTQIATDTYEAYKKKE